jgi:N-acylglucosamine-6-phosphate 2-epimerase
MMRSTFAMPAALQGKLIVSCQAAQGDPLDDARVLTQIALSAIRGGAGGLRANGAANIAAFRAKTAVPILGIQKEYVGGEVYITPTFAAAAEIAGAGADVVALDCTARRLKEAEPWPQLIIRIHEELKRPVLADIATLEDAVAAAGAGADAVATTLFGFTAETRQHRAVNWALVESIVKAVGVPLIVEGHIRQPEDVRRALDAGAYAVVVGSAITSPEALAARFVQAIQG